MFSLSTSSSRLAEISPLLIRTGRGGNFRLLYGFLLGVLLTFGGLSIGASVSAQGKPLVPPKDNGAVSLGPNLMQSGDFAPGAMAWKAELMNGKASAALSWPADAPPSGATGKVARFDVEAIDKERWHVQFYHDNLDLNEREAYTFTFWAKAAQQRPLSVSANVDEEDYHPIGLDSRVVIGPQWRKVSLAFTALNTRKNHSRLCFMLGEALGRVELADVRLQKGVTASAPGSNLLRNANFEQGVTSWLPLNTEAPAQAMLKIADEPPAAVRGKVAHIAITDPGSQIWHVYFGQEGLSLEEGAVYTLSFWGKSNRNRTLNVHSDVAMGDYHQTGLTQVVALTPDWNKFTFVFTPTNTGSSAGRIIFSAGNASGDVDLAGVALQRGAVLPRPVPAANPDSQATRNTTGKTANGATGQGGTRAHRSHPLLGTWQSFHKEVGLTGKEYQRYRFVFEASGNGSLQVATMSADPAAPPKSQQTETFKWDLIEGGPHVTIGSNVYTWTIEKDGEKQKLTLKNYEGKTYILYRQ